METPRFPLRLLVVDDCPDNAEILAELLRLSGDDVRVAYSAAAAVQVAIGFKPQAGLIDIGMPRCDGYSLATQLRQSTELRTMHLIAVSGYGDAPHQDRAANAGFGAYIVKPYRMSEVNEAIETVRHLVYTSALTQAVSDCQADLSSSVLERL